MFIMELLGKRGSLTSGDIAKKLLTRKGLHRDNPTLLRRQQHEIYTTLNKMKHRGAAAHDGRVAKGRGGCGI